MTRDTKWQTQADMLINRVRKNRRRLKGWLSANRVTCYRLYDRDIPEIPLCVDWYEGRLHVALYERRLKAGDDEQWVGGLSSSLADALEVAPERLFIKHRRQADGGTQYGLFGSKGELLSVNEDGLTFWVNLTDYVDTGLFLDHRLTRRMVREMSRGKRVLNLFAYTGAFSVHAAAGGAASVTTVDLSKTYLEWAEKNMSTNGFTGDAYRYVRDDILGTLRDGELEGRYDLMIVDPPTISKSKRMASSLDIQRDHAMMLNRLLEHLSDGGTVFFSNNYTRFKLDTSALGPCRVEEITQKTTSKDFAGRPNHRCWRMDK